MKTLARHVSPDKRLTFVVHEEDDDIILGFEESAWHTHGDLVATGGHDLVEAALAFTQAVVSDRLLIAVGRFGAERYVSIVFDPVDDALNAAPGEDIEFRFWSGKQRWHGREIVQVVPTWLTSWPPEHALLAGHSTRA